MLPSSPTSLSGICSQGQCASLFWLSKAQICEGPSRNSVAFHMRNTDKFYMDKEHFCHEGQGKKSTIGPIDHL
jgi:hypothetical protein